jgi:hypothetical protein
MGKKIWIGALVALSSLALLAPAGSARAATLHGAPFCVVRGSNVGITLKPGQRCTFYPLATNGFFVFFHAIRAGSYSGSICGGITRYPPLNSNTPLNDSAQPTSWDCVPASNLNNRGDSALGRRVQNGFGAVYGQATILNFSNATIKFPDGAGLNCGNGGFVNCVYYYA